jgi:hypothetical protein
MFGATMPGKEARGNQSFGEGVNGAEHGTPFDASLAHDRKCRGSGQAGFGKPKDLN